MSMTLIAELLKNATAKAGRTPDRMAGREDASSDAVRELTAETAPATVRDTAATAEATEERSGIDRTDTGRTPEAEPATDGTATLWHDRIEQWLARAGESEGRRIECRDADAPAAPADGADPLWHDAPQSEPLPPRAEDGARAVDGMDGMDGMDDMLRHLLTRPSETVAPDEVEARTADAVTDMVEALRPVAAPELPDERPVDLSHLDTAA